MASQNSSVVLLITGLVLICFASCSSATTTMLAGSGHPAVDFEAILLRRLSFNNTATQNVSDIEHVGVAQVVETIGYLFASPHTLNQTFDKVPELQYHAFWEVVESAKALEVLSTHELPAHIDAMTARVAQLPTHLCWPVLRRIVLAALMHHRLQHGPLSTDASTAVVRLCVQFFQLHRTAAARKGIIDFFHISKAGGTTFCQLAKLNGCRTQSFAARRNCLIREFDDVPRWVNNSLHNHLAPRGLRTPWFANWGTKQRNPVSCQIRKRFMLRRHFNIYANEFTVYGAQRVPRNAHVCPGHLNVLQLRHPHLRLRSHLMWVWALYDHTFREQAPAFFPTHGLPHWRSLLPAATDNYYVRSLLGESVYFLPGDNLTQAHLSAARLAMTMFDVLLLLEQPSMNEVLYEMAIGWGLGFGAVHARTSTQVHEVGRQGLPEAEEWQQLLKRNALDLELYRFGSLLALLDALVFDVAKESGLGSGYSAVGSEGGGDVAVVAGPRAVKPGDDEQWELSRGGGGGDGGGDGGSGPAARRGTCGFVSAHEGDQALPSWVVV
ncbi:hypothetical protein VOLCADRAFT_99677 [Volvox carteri f. nagariensis]|uniref:Uncharacterized protein n=1 Tax=Volvox carteri f. nagariensis TaxID=3068 RepID=D8UIC5_VOLCA|nr:uncharacterized protein VOLCADRAFT_99677 [Volvox carteri f. nagariensis]EFJ40544.1 hypothetical protein VOLCADRAFT_99677 [Volvox carteri f. nagariensis]|eukprot:XP_002958394.1 hypothetical protein VOLCADRAFT_99677 [Volvox carteri f. nagariensis]